MSWTQEKIKETVAAIKEKSADATFRASLKANTNATIEDVAGLQLPNGFTIQVADANDADLTIALPKSNNDELSDSDLESVAGGKDSSSMPVDAHGNSIIVY